MTTLVLNEETAKTPLGEMLSSASGSEIEIRSEAGDLLARVLVVSQGAGDVQRSAMEIAEAEIEELRRRSQSDRSGDLTTEALLTHLRALTGE